MALIALLAGAATLWWPGAQPSIAVMPFMNLSAEEEDEYLSDGITDEVIIALGQVEGLKVVGRNSVFRYKGKQYDPLEVGAELGVSMPLEGNVRTEKGRLRVSVQLINAADRFELWSQRFDRESQGIFDIQDDVARSIVETLKIQLVADAPLLSRTRHPDNIEAYKLFLEGRYHQYKWTPDGLTKAEKYFEQAISIEPDYAQAYASLAPNYAYRVDYVWIPPSQAIPEARANALKALQIDDSVADGHVALGYVRHLYDWNWPGAESDFRRAIALDPANPRARAHYSWYLITMGRHTEAIAEANRRLELDPVSPIAHTVLARACHFARRDKEALAAAGRMHEPAGPASFTGRLQQGWIYARTGRRQEALRVLHELMERREPEYVPASAIALLYSGPGQTDETFEWIEKAYEERNAQMLLVITDRKMESIRSDPRYRDLLRRLKLDN